jgi:hypothetical protein
MVMTFWRECHHGGEGKTILKPYKKVRRWRSKAKEESGLGESPSRCIEKKRNPFNG